LKRAFHFIVALFAILGVSLLLADLLVLPALHLYPIFINGFGTTAAFILLVATGGIYYQRWKRWKSAAIESGEVRRMLMIYQVFLVDLVRLVVTTLVLLAVILIISLNDLVFK